MIELNDYKCLIFENSKMYMGKVSEGSEKLGKPIVWGMGWVYRRLGNFGDHPIVSNRVNFNLSSSKNLSRLNGPQTK